LLRGEEFLDEIVMGKIFRVGPRSFFQVNIGMLPLVVSDMESAIASSGMRNARLADLYCGIGTLGILLAKEGQKVTGVESEGANIACLRKNLELNRIEGYRILEGRSERWISSIVKEGVDILVLDPPRRGVEPGLIQILGDSPVSLVLYLSCNPSTLVRDLKNLLKSYELKSLKVYDFFPHTPHIESLAVLKTGVPSISRQAGRRRLRYRGPLIAAA
jgi:tRNA/tmRNA/rRNA uracil-C5-methylase (TrmA/RlmC/RlmD family)